MFEYLINSLIEELKEQLGPLFNGAYKENFSDIVGISTDTEYQFYIVENELNANVSSSENKFGPTLFTKEFRLVIQFTDKVDKELIIKKSLIALNKFSANGIRFNEDSKFIQDSETKQKAKLDIPLVMFTFNLKRAIVLNECKELISEYGC